MSVSKSTGRLAVRSRRFLAAGSAARYDDLRLTNIDKAAQTITGVRRTGRYGAGHEKTIRSDDTVGGVRPEDCRVQRMGILGRRQRRLSWVGFFLLALYAPILAWIRPDDTWMFSVAVAGMVGYVIVIDDYYRRRHAREAASQAQLQPVVAQMPSTRDCPDGDSSGSTSTD
jgi:hypothetical protein